MTSLALLYDVYVSHDVYDIFLHDIQRTHQVIHDKFGKVILFNIVSDAVDQRMRQLAPQ